MAVLGSADRPVGQLCLVQFIQAIEFALALYSHFLVDATARSG
jgi:hypothetical protein